LLRYCCCKKTEPSKEQKGLNPLSVQVQGNQGKVSPPTSQNDDLKLNQEGLKSGSNSENKDDGLNP